MVGLVIVVGLYNWINEPVTPVFTGIKNTRPGIRPRHRRHDGHCHPGLVVLAGRRRPLDRIGRGSLCDIRQSVGPQQILHAPAASAVFYYDYVFVCAIRHCSRSDGERGWNGAGCLMFDVGCLIINFIKYQASKVIPARESGHAAPVQ